MSSPISWKPRPPSSFRVRRVKRRDNKSEKTAISWPSERARPHIPLFPPSSLALPLALTVTPLQRTRAFQTYMSNTHWVAAARFGDYLCANCSNLAWCRWLCSNSQTPELTNLSPQTPKPNKQTEKFNVPFSSFSTGPDFLSRLQMKITHDKCSSEIRAKAKIDC